MDNESNVSNRIIMVSKDFKPLIKSETFSTNIHETNDSLLLTGPDITGLIKCEVLETDLRLVKVENNFDAEINDYNIDTKELICNMSGELVESTNQQDTYEDENPESNYSICVIKQEFDCDNEDGSLTKHSNPEEDSSQNSFSSQKDDSNKNERQTQTSSTSAGSRNSSRYYMTKYLDPNKIYQCSTCQYKTENADYVESLRVDEGSVKYFCLFCSYQMKQKKSEEVLPPQPQHCCTHCGCQSESLAGLMKHVESEHNNKDVEKHFCMHWRCDFQTESLVHLKQHVESEHPTNNDHNRQDSNDTSNNGYAIYKCPYCNYTNRSRLECKRHLKKKHKNVKTGTF